VHPGKASLRERHWHGIGDINKEKTNFFSFEEFIIYRNNMMHV
jgi:hypothetical protein